jgi:hypothetical protein
MSEDHKCLKRFDRILQTIVLQKMGVNLSYASLIYEEKIESVMEEEDESGSRCEFTYQA